MMVWVDRKKDAGDLSQFFWRDETPSFQRNYQKTQGANLLGLFILPVLEVQLFVAYRLLSSACQETKQARHICSMTCQSSRLEFSVFLIRLLLSSTASFSFIKVIVISVSASPKILRIQYSS
jgi:hypothetical protein